jgi:hypothetical protein
MTANGTDQYREEEIRRALTVDPRVGEPELTVSIRGAEVTVRGVVPTETRREQVADVVRDLAPDLVYVDRLEVADRFTQPPAGDEEPIG